MFQRNKRLFIKYVKIAENLKNNTGHEYLVIKEGYFLNIFEKNMYKLLYKDCKNVKILYHAKNN